jgi:hypothetical protein
LFIGGLFKNIKASYKPLMILKSLTGFWGFKTFIEVKILKNNSDDFKIPDGILGFRG